MVFCINSLPGTETTTAGGFRRGGFAVRRPGLGVARSPWPQCGLASDNDGSDDSFMDPREEPESLKAQAWLERPGRIAQNVGSRLTCISEIRHEQRHPSHHH